MSKTIEVSPQEFQRLSTLEYVTVKRHWRERPDDLTLPDKTIKQVLRRIEFDDGTAVQVTAD